MLVPLKSISFFVRAVQYSIVWLYLWPFNPRMFIGLPSLCSTDNSTVNSLVNI